jgi:hypothetical protein
MLAELLAESHVVGVSAILITVNRHGPMPKSEILEICGTYGLRAGGIPWAAAMVRAEAFKLVERQDSGSYSLSPLLSLA